MNSNPYPQPVAYLYLGVGDTPIRAYCFYNIDTATYNHPEFDPHMFAQLMRVRHRLSYPYTWCVYGTDTAVIVNITDLHVHDTRYRLPPTYHIPVHPYDEHAPHAVPYYNSSSAYDDEVEANEAFNLDLEGLLNDNIIQESPQVNFVASSGLTTEEISKNLQLTDYCKEDEDEEEGDGEICVVCLVEFEKKERAGVLQCKHRYHPECITRWLIRQNVCPLCKGEGLRV